MEKIKKATDKILDGIEFLEKKTPLKYIAPNRKKEVVKDYEIVEIDKFTRNQSNIAQQITEARNKMTALELKAFYQLTTLINMSDLDYNEYSIDINEFCRALDIDVKNRPQIKNLCESLLKKDFIIDYQRDNGSWTLYKITIFQRFSYCANEQRIYVTFGEQLKPYLLELKERFTKIEQVKYITNFSSKYAIRFYAFLKDYRKMSQRDFNLEALYKTLELPKSYNNYTNFYLKVLKPAITEINDKSDLWVSEPEIIKTKGKKVTDIRLYFSNQSDKMAGDFIRAVMNFYKKYKSFNVFLNQPYMTATDNKTIYTITSIKTETHPYYFTLLGKNTDTRVDDGVKCLYDIGNQDDFLLNVTNGIYKALLFKYNEMRKEKTPTEIWQSEQDKLKEIKEIFMQNLENNPKSKVLSFYNTL